MYSKNIVTFLLHLIGTSGGPSGGKDGAKQPSLVLSLEDEITRDTLLTRDGAVVHARIKELLG
jgi:hypothetical protein